MDFDSGFSLFTNLPAGRCNKSRANEAFYLYLKQNQQVTEVFAVELSCPIIWTVRNIVLLLYRPAGLPTLDAYHFGQAKLRLFRVHFLDRRCLAEPPNLTGRDPQWADW
jgi:hypothetical protein